MSEPNHILQKKLHQPNPQTTNEMSSAIAENAVDYAIAMAKNAVLDRVEHEYRAQIIELEQQLLDGLDPEKAQVYSALDILMHQYTLSLVELGVHTGVKLQSALQGNKQLISKEV